MTDTRPLLRLLDRDYLFKLILFLLAYSLVPIAEIILFVYLGNLIGNYLTFAIAAVAGTGGALVALSQARRTRERLREKIRRGADTAGELAEGAGILLSGVLLLTPGFITDALGYVLLVPSVRAAAGRLVLKRLGPAVGDIHQYLRARLGQL
jgi:UPF0716 protein FxsA